MVISLGLLRVEATVMRIDSKSGWLVLAISIVLISSVILVVCWSRISGQYGDSNDTSFCSWCGIKVFGEGLLRVNEDGTATIKTTKGELLIREKIAGLNKCHGWRVSYDGLLFQNVFSSEKSLEDIMFIKGNFTKNHESCYQAQGFNPVPMN